MNKFEILLQFTRRRFFAVVLLFITLFFSPISFLDAFTPDVLAQTVKEGESAASGVELPQFEAGSQPSAPLQVPEGGAVEGAGVLFNTVHFLE